jgi:hypothetical protein
LEEVLRGLGSREISKQNGGKSSLMSSGNIAPNRGVANGGVLDLESTPEQPKVGSEPLPKRQKKDRNCCLQLFTSLTQPCTLQPLTIQLDSLSRNRENKIS